MAVFRKDLKAAGIPETDDEKRRVDFHSLRKSLATLLAKSGATPRTAMEVMRHTDLRLTMSVYTDPTLLDTSGAVEQLPDLTAADDAVSGGLRTGTDDLPLTAGAAGQITKVLPKSTARPGTSRHTQAQRKGPDGPKSGIPHSFLAPQRQPSSELSPALSNREAPGRPATVSGKPAFCPSTRPNEWRTESRWTSIAAAISAHTPGRVSSARFAD